jgi:hypothetical protein
MIDLKPCPFCGTSDDFEGSPFPTGRASDRWCVRCGNPNCNAEVVGYTPEEAIRFWNTRAQLDPLPANGAYIVMYDDTDQANELFSGWGAKDAAYHRYAQISNNWNAHLFVKIHSNSRDCAVPDATLGKV